MKKSVAFRISLKFMLVLASSVIALSCAMIALIYFFVRNEQNRELMDAAIKIERIVGERMVPLQRIPPDDKNGPEKIEPEKIEPEKIEPEKTEPEKTETERSEKRKPSFSRRQPALPFELSRIPYYISYVVTSTESDFSQKVFTNDQMMPILPKTDSRAKIYVSKGFYIDGDLKVLYMTKTTPDEKYLIQVSLDMERDISSHLLDKILPAIAIAVVPILLLSFLISLLITKNTMSPVVRLTKSAEKISSSNLGTLLPRSGTGDEIDSLAATFNSLFVRLKADFEREKNFTSDVSHELKTPVAVILGQANLLLRWGKDDSEQLQKSLESIKNEAKSMDSIITSLLEVSRIENGKVKPVISDVDLRKMFLRIVEEFLSVYPDVDFVLPEEGSETIRTDSELLHQVLTVAVSNSVKFSGRECTVRLGWEKIDSAMRIFIEDDGPGFSESVLPNVFKRFYRGDEAHVRSVGGAGLGLSIAQTVVESLGGKISAYNCEPHGAGISVELPC